MVTTINYKGLTVIKDPSSSSPQGNLTGAGGDLIQDNFVFIADTLETLSTTGGGSGISLTQLTNVSGWSRVYTDSISGYIANVYAKRSYLDSVSGYFANFGSASAPLTLTGSSDAVQLSVIGFSSQTTNLQQWKNSTGNVLASIDKRGILRTYGLIEPEVGLIDQATIPTDAASGSFFKVTLGGNRTLGNPVNAVSGQQFRWAIAQDNTGTRTLALDTKFYTGPFGTPVFSTSSGAVDLLAAKYESDKDIFRITAFLPQDGDLTQNAVSGYLDGRINAVSGYFTNTMLQRSYVDSVSGYFTNVMLSRSYVDSVSGYAAVTYDTRVHADAISGYNNNASNLGAGTVPVLRRLPIVQSVLTTGGVSVSTDASLYDSMDVRASGNFILNNPTNSANGQKFIWRVCNVGGGSGACTVSFDTNFRLNTTIPAIYPVASGKTDYIGAMYDTINGITKWDIVAYCSGVN